MLEQAGAVCGDKWLEIRIFLPCLESRPVKERNYFIQKSGITGGFKILDDGVGQP